MFWLFHIYRGIYVPPNRKVLCTADRMSLPSAQNFLRCISWCWYYATFFFRDVRTWTVIYFDTSPYLQYNLTGAKLDFSKMTFEWYIILFYCGISSFSWLLSKRYVFAISWLCHTRKDLTFRNFLIFSFCNGAGIGGGRKWLSSDRVCLMRNLSCLYADQISFD